MSIRLTESLLASLFLGTILITGSACSKQHKSDPDTDSDEAGAETDDGGGDQGDEDDDGDAGQSTSGQDGSAAKNDAQAPKDDNATQDASSADAASATDAGVSSSGDASNGASDAGTSDAGSMRDAAATPGDDQPASISCAASGNKTEHCSLPSQVCCPGQGCVAAATGCNSPISFSCDGPEDCSGSQVCCANGAQLACAASCQLLAACHADDDCEDGASCVALGDQLGVCFPQFPAFDAGGGGFPHFDGGFNFPGFDGGFNFPGFDGGFPFPRP